MSITGTDLQTLIVRSTEAGKIQQTQKAGESARQQNFAVELTRQSESAASMVQNLPRAEQGMIDSEQSKREKQSPPERKVQTKEDEAAEEPVVASGNIIDLRI